MTERVQVSKMELLPLELWSMIAENLTSDSKSILNCRKVCSKFINEINRSMTRVKPPELDPLTIDEIPVKGLRPTKLRNLDSMMQFLQQMKNHEGNPFPTRALSLNPLNPKDFGCSDNCSCPGRFNEYILLCQFCKRFGKEVYRLQFEMENKDAVRHLDIFHNFPNIRLLEVRVVGENTGKEKSIGESFRQLNNFTFALLPNLTHLKLFFGGVEGNELMTKILKAYGRHLTSLSVSIVTHVNLNAASTASFGQLNSLVDIPFLTNLKIQFMPRGHQNVLNFLKNGHWRLKQLSLCEMKSDFCATYNLSDVMDIISKYSWTLEILHLYFFSGSKLLKELRLLSQPNKFTPDEVANKLQVGIKLPWVREVSFPYDAVSTKISATGRFLERFDNLTTLHLFDSDDDTHNSYNYELNPKWWHDFFPECNLERIIIFNGNEFFDDVVVRKVIKLA